MVAVVVVAVVAWWLTGYKAEEPSPAGASISDADTTTEIDKELSATDLGNLEGEIDSVSQDLNSL